MPQNSSSSLKSLHHDGPAFITFVNRTNFPVDVIWVDYKGNFVRYCKRLEPGRCQYQNTFETHPWLAWDSDTLENATFSGEYVYYPVRWKGEQHRTVVYIDRPMRSLLDICTAKVRSLVKTDNLEQLEIPRDLVERLGKGRKVEFREYRPHHRVP